MLNHSALPSYAESGGYRASKRRGRVEVAAYDEAAPVCVRCEIGQDHVQRAQPPAGQETHIGRKTGQGVGHQLPRVGVEASTGAPPCPDPKPDTLKINNAQPGRY